MISGSHSNFTVSPFIDLVVFDSATDKSSQLSQNYNLKNSWLQIQNTI